MPAGKCDALGRRIQRTESGDVRNSHLSAKSDPADYETNGTGSLSAAYLRGAGGLISQTDYTGQTSETAFAFSPNDWLISASDAAGGVTGYAYDKAGSRTQQTDAEGRATLYAFDELNRLKEEKVDAGGGSYLLQRSYTYDKAGHLKTDITGAGTIASTYDDVYNLTGVTDRQGASYSYTHDANQNQLSAVENATGKTVSFGYSPRGLLSQAIIAPGGSESYSYDAAGNLA